MIGAISVRAFLVVCVFSDNIQSKSVTAEVYSISSVATMHAFVSSVRHVSYIV